MGGPLLSTFRTAAAIRVMLPTPIRIAVGGTNPMKRSCSPAAERGARATSSKSNENDSQRDGALSQVDLPFTPDHAVAGPLDEEA